jgi:N-glycosylase/DNA lyase
VTRLLLGATPPFRLAAVVLSHGWFQTPPFAWRGAAGVLERVEAVDGAAVRLRVRGTPAGVSARTGAELTSAGAAVLRAWLRRMLQIDLDLGGFHAALAYDPPLRDDLVAYGAGRLLAGATLYEDVVKAICGTNIAWPQAVACISRIVAWSDDGTFPGAEVVLAAGEERLRREARVGYRAPALLAAARAAADGRLAEIDRAAPSLEGRELSERLVGLPGVGGTTAGFLCLLMGRHDVPVVDSATLRLAGRRWFGGRRPARAEVLERVAPAGPWSGLALYWAMLRAWHDESGLEAAR